MLNLFQHLNKTLKHVQGDWVGVLAMRLTMPIYAVMLNSVQHPITSVVMLNLFRHLE